MKNSNISNIYQPFDTHEIKEIEKKLVKNTSYVTRFIYESNKADPLTIPDDLHLSQRRRYYNSRRGV